MGFLVYDASVIKEVSRSRPVVRPFWIMVWSVIVDDPGGDIDATPTVCLLYNE